VASAHSAATTLKFTAVQKATHSFTSTTFGIQETDVNSTGKTIGFDMLYFTATSATTGAANVTVDTKGGFLYGLVATTNGGKTFSGKVTGEPAHSKEPPERSRPRPSPAPGTPSRSLTTASKVRHPDRGGTAYAARPFRLLLIKVASQTDPPTTSPLDDLFPIRFPPARP
jgi:hypothetical protein